MNKRFLLNCLFIVEIGYLLSKLIFIIFSKDIEIGIYYVIMEVWIFSYSNINVSLVFLWEVLFFCEGVVFLLWGRINFGL